MEDWDSPQMRIERAKGNIENAKYELEEAKKSENYDFQKNSASIITIYLKECFEIVVPLINKETKKHFPNFINGIGKLEGICTKDISHLCYLVPIFEEIKKNYYQRIKETV